jgi:hypothetical protein
MEDKVYLCDMASCLARIYYAYVEKIRGNKDAIHEVQISSLFNVFDYVKSKGYNAVKLTATSFSVTFD